MKIGILTFHKVENYGAVLQVIGLQEKLKELGYECEIINYSIFKKNKFYKGLGIKDYGIIYFIKNLKFIITKKINFIRKQIYFERFIQKNLNLSKEVKFIELPNLKYDIVIVGSDQVWNYYTTNKSFHSEFFLNFGNFTKISYAPSIGNKQPNEYSKFIANCLSDFKAISVRDDLTKEYVRNLISIDAPIVCDPTLFINYDKFTNDYFELDQLSNNFFLVYAFNESKVFCDIIESLKVTLKLQTVIVGSQSYEKYADFFLPCCRIENWLYLFKNANFVFTHSFHGVVFSLKYNIDFLAFKYSSNNIINERVLDMAQRYGFYERIIDSVESVDEIIKNKMNYSNINKKIEDHINGSTQFIIESLKL